MKKLMLLAAMLAMVLAVAIPAIAQVVGENGQETDSTGDVSLDTSVESSGNNSSSCVAPLQFGNTGNFQNNQNFIQYSSIADDIEFSAGDGFSFAPEQAIECTQSVEQAAAASGGGK
jgi:hypothetical protein